MYYELTKLFEHTEKDRKTPETTFRTNEVEIWGDKKIAVQPGKCKIMDICIPMDVNVTREEKEKCDRYFLLSSRLQRLYPQYTYEIIPIVLGSTGYVPKTLPGHLEKCGFEKTRTNTIIQQMQRKALQGSVKIVKTAMKM